MAKTRPKIKWRDARPVDAYERHEAYLWGAKSHLFPGCVLPPRHPALQEEFYAGAAIACAGYITMTTDANPTELVRRIKQEHQLKRAERAAGVGI